MSWVRLWLDLPTDPKFRVIARKCGRPLPEVIAVFVYMLTVAGKRTDGERTQANASERGELFGWCDDDAAAALDMDAATIAAIREAMQGKVLDGLRLVGWEKRQPKREDGSAERAKRWRERKRTQANASERPDSDTDISDDISSFRSDTDAARERSEQNSIKGLAKGERGAGAYHDARRRAEGLGLPVSEIEAATERAKPTNRAAYFASLCVNRLQSQIPTVPRNVIAAALAGQSSAYTLVCAAMMGQPS